MCANYTYFLNPKVLQNHFEGMYVDPVAEFPLVKEEIFPFTFAPVLVLSGGRVVLTVKRYSLTPHWAPEEKVKWATYNARLKRKNQKTGKEEYIYEAPTWREAFKSRHCLVPMTSFRESCHEGEAQGHIVNFTPAEADMVFAAGIYEDWTNKKTGEVISTFAIITTEPDDYIKAVGHDRSPVFLSGEDVRTWLQGFPSAKESYDFLLRAHRPPKMEYKLVRALKSAASDRQTSYNI